MKTITKLSLVVLLAAFAMSAAASDDPAVIFKSRCAACHGADGTADTPMGKKLNVRNLQSEEVQAMSDEEIAEVISTGKNKMPSFAKKLSKEQIDALVEHIRSLGKD